MKKVVLLFAALAMLCVLNVSCSDDDGPVNAKDIVYDATSISVPYNGSVDLDTLIKLDTEGAVGDLAYSITKQPFYTDAVTGVDGQTVTAFELVDGHILKSKTDVRVPDTLGGTSTRTRSVIDGELKITLTVLTQEITTLNVKIVQTDRPAASVVFPDEDAVITFVNNLNFTDADNGNKKITMNTTGQYTTLGAASFFTVMPLDYEPNRILLRTSPGAVYLETASSGDIRTGGDYEKHGTGEYVVGFYCSAKGADESDNDYQAREAAAYQAAIESGENRVYVDVNYVAANEIVGIVLNTEAIGTASNASFWRNNANGRQAGLGFVLAKLNDGTTAVYNENDHGVLMCGEFDSYLEGRNTEYEGFSGWWNSVAVKLAFNIDVDCPVDTPLTFKITHKDHYLEDGWTVTVNTKRLAANPG